MYYLSMWQDIDRIGNSLYKAAELTGGRQAAFYKIAKRFYNLTMISFFHIKITRAGIAQLVEYKLPKLGVAGSNPVARSKKVLFPFRGKKLLAR